jgi:hypothetical protein
MYQLGYIGTGLMGLIGLCVSGCWLAHIIVYMLPPIPIHPLLNEVFIKLDGVFPLFGVAAFAAFSGYLLSEWRGVYGWWKQAVQLGVKGAAAESISAVYAWLKRCGSCQLQHACRGCQ